ncbi:RNA-binding protein, partial [Streptomyces oceani]
MAERTGGERDPDREPPDEPPDVPSGPEATPESAAGQRRETLDSPLPEKVRRRVVSLTGDALGALTVAELPVPLRQYARFTPQRRTKFGGNAMAAALAGDAAFRQRIAGRLRESLPELAEAV